VLISSSALVPARAAKPVMTNKTIQAMVSGGVPLSMIVRAIRIAPQIDLYMNDRERAALKAAGAADSEIDEIMKAIHYREYTGVDRSPEFNFQVAVVIPPAAPEFPPEGLTAAVLPVPALPVLSATKTLKDGTPIKLCLSQNLSSADATAKQSVDFEVMEAVRVGELTVIPKGSAAWGTIMGAEAGRHRGHAGVLDINVDAVRLADGEKVSLKGAGHFAAQPPSTLLASLFQSVVPVFFPQHAKGVRIPKGTELTGYINGNATFDAGKFTGVQNFGA